MPSRGVPALAVAYFDSPGLPRRLDRIPLEYFAGALTSPSALVYGAEGSHGHPTASAWTLRGKQVPFAKIWNDLSPIGTDARAIIPVERIHGPILTAAGGSDAVWASSAFARAIQRRLTGHHDPWQHTNLN